MPVETVNTVVVQDREYGQDGKPLVNQEVTVRLAPAAIYIIAAGADGNTDQVALQATEMRTKTDATGFWSVSLVPNVVITPANTYYSVKVGLLKSYDIAIPTGAGPFIASNNLTGPLPIFPGGSSVAGPITITGNLSVTGSGTFSGALQANAGLAVLGGGNVAGGWTVAGLLTMTDAASRLVPGATSFSIRDTGNVNDNLLVSNVGNVTVRGTLSAGGQLVISAGGASITGGATVATGDLSVSAGRIVMGAAVSKIVPGATSLSLRNTADTADNALVADGGLVTLRNALTIPSAAGGAVPATSYGTVPLKFFETVLGVATGFITITIPSGFRSIVLMGQLITDQAGSQSANIQFNGDTGNNYDWILKQTTAVPADGSSAAVLTSSARFATAPTGHGEFTVEIPNYALTTLAKGFTCRNTRFDSTLTHETGIGNWRSTAAIASIKLFPTAGNFAAGSAVFGYLLP
jgi:hypothetical protein